MNQRDNKRPHKNRPGDAGTVKMATIKNKINESTAEEGNENRSKTISIA